MKSCGCCCPGAPKPAPAVLATSRATKRAVALKIRRVDMNAFSLPDEKLPRAESRGRAGRDGFLVRPETGGLRGFGNVIQRNGRPAQVAGGASASVPEEPEVEVCGLHDADEEAYEETEQFYRSE